MTQPTIFRTKEMSVRLTYNSILFDCRLVDQQDGSLPSFTLCPPSDYSYNKTVLKQHGIDKKQLYSGRANPTNLVWWSNDSSTSTEELFQLATVKVKDFIQPIIFQTINTTYDPEDEKNVSLFKIFYSPDHVFGL